MTFRIITNPTEWEAVRSKLDCSSVYSSYDWVSAAARLEEGGRAEMAVLEDETAGVLCIHPYVRRSIAGTEYFDLISAFDFGGWWGVHPPAALYMDKQFTEYCRGAGIVSEFCRLSPWGLPAPTTYDAIHVRDNVIIPTGPGAPAGYHHSLHADLRKAASYGLAFRDVGIGEFTTLLHRGVREKGRSPYYLFPMAFFEDIELRVRCLGAYLPDGRLCAAHLYVQDGQRLLYFLSAADPALLFCKPNDALIDHVLRTSAPRFTELHLGGGEPESLMAFKRKFGPGRIAYHVARRVFLPDVYERLSRGHDAAKFPSYRW